MTNVTFPDFNSFLPFRTANTKVTGSTGFKVYDEDGYEIYTSCKRLIINSRSDACLSVMDINGRLLINEKISAGSTNIQIELTGIYLINVTGDMGSVTKKVFIE
jgi:hypothetical protein